MPLASSGANSPLSATSTASFRTAVIRTLMETAPSGRTQPHGQWKSRLIYIAWQRTIDCFNKYVRA
jgi:hypothetical protein